MPSGQGYTRDTRNKLISGEPDPATPSTHPTPMEAVTVCEVAGDMESRMDDELLLLDPISPPRRYSMADYDTAKVWLGPRLLIRLDGEEVEYVTAFNCDAGTVERLVTDERGNFRTDAAGLGAERETLRGNVTVEWREA